MAEYKTREYPLFSACGLNCGLCPRHYTEGSSRCPGCADVGFSKVHPPCGLLSCCQRKNLEYCFDCDEFPCKKYDGADLSDSFITHKNQIVDMEKAKQIGMNAYSNELNEKIGILEELLNHYNDGRRKNLYCVAINLLELHDIKAVITQLKSNVNAEMTIKEKAVIAVQLFEEIAEQRGVSLKLRKRNVKW